MGIAIGSALLVDEYRLQSDTDYKLGSQESDQ